MGYDANEIRNRLKKAVPGRTRDPDEFRPEKATAQTSPKYKFFFLPPLNAGDELKSGVIEETMENFFIKHGAHYIGQQVLQCPRLYDGGDCQLCKAGFDLLNEADSDDEKKNIRGIWMPGQYFAVNAFFPNLKANPEGLRNKVRWYNAPLTVINECAACICRDDAGDDPQDPLAHGVFYDEQAAFMFQLECVLNGKNNDYKKSKFLPQRQPIARQQNGEPYEPAIQLILRSRHNLFTKIEKPDIDRLNKFAAVLLEQDSGGGFDVDEAQQKVAAATAATSKNKSSKPASQAPPKATPKPTTTAVVKPAAKKPTPPPKQEPAPAPPDADEQAAPFNGDSNGEEIPATVGAGGDDLPASGEIDDLLKQLG